MGLQLQAELFFKCGKDRWARGGWVLLRTIRRPFEGEIEEALKTGLVDYDSVRGSVRDSRVVRQGRDQPCHRLVMEFEASVCVFDAELAAFGGLEF